MFEEKIALVTGGVKGMGLEYVKQLLQNGIKGVTIVDIDGERGIEIEKRLREEFGNKVIFLQADISQNDQLTGAFECAFKHWNDLGIVINNAAICNEKDWEKTISVNCGGIVNGTYLAFEYMSKLKGRKGGVVINVSSLAALDGCFFIPTYTATKSFVVSFGRSLSTEFYYEHNRVKVMTVCPGFTDTLIVEDVTTNIFSNFGPNLSEVTNEIVNSLKIQSPGHVAKTVLNLIDQAENGSVWVVEPDQLPYQTFDYKSANLRFKPSNSKEIDQNEINEKLNVVDKEITLKTI